MANRTQFSGVKTFALCTQEVSTCSSNGRGLCGMTNNSIDNLDPIDRYFSEVLDVHTWSDHPDIKDLTNLIYDELGCAELQSRSNNQGNISVKNMLRVLLLDLYVRWLTDPNLATGFHKHPRNYKPK